MGQSQNMDAVHALRQHNPEVTGTFDEGSPWALNKKRHEEMVQNQRDRERDVHTRLVGDQIRQRLVLN